MNKPWLEARYPEYILVVNDFCVSMILFGGIQPRVLARVLVQASKSRIIPLDLEVHLIAHFERCHYLPQFIYAIDFWFE